MAEIQFKEWLRSEAIRLDMTPAGIFSRLKRGLYPGLKLRRVNCRRVFVTVSDADLAAQPERKARPETCECGNTKTAGARACARCAAIEKRLATFSYQRMPPKTEAERGLPEHVLHLNH